MANEQPQSKSYKISGKRLTGSIIKRFNNNPTGLPTAFESAIPALGSPHPYSPDKLYFFDADWQPRVGEYGDLILNYSWKSSGQTDSELRTSVIEAPLSTRADYLLQWDHNLYTSNDTPILPSWWDSTKSLEEFTANNVDNIYSVKTNVNAGVGILAMGRTKAKNTYKKPSTVVLESIWWDDEQFANSYSLAIGLLAEPLNTYDRPSGDGNRWLVTSAPISRDGGYWVVRTTYEYNDDVVTDGLGVQKIGWDVDLYDR
jgi:hypothetical protein